GERITTRESFDARTPAQNHRSRTCEGSISGDRESGRRNLDRAGVSDPALKHSQIRILHLDDSSIGEGVQDGGVSKLDEAAAHCRKRAARVSAVEQLHDSAVQRFNDAARVVETHRPTRYECENTSTARFHSTGIDHAGGLHRKRATGGVDRTLINEI